jgi:hypothetical protein
MAARITNITFILHANHDFETEADHNYDDGSVPRHVQLKIPGYHYDYYLQVVSGSVIPNQRIGGTGSLTGAQIDAYITSNPAALAADVITFILQNAPAAEAGDVARFLHALYYPIYMNPPSATASPTTGSAPDIA